MIVLGIESSAHTFGVGIVDKGKVLSNEKIMYPINTSGIIPAKAAEFHSGNAAKVIKNALSSAGISIDDVEGVAYTAGPGIGPCLQVGQLSAKAIAQELGIKIAQVNHCVAHIEIARILSGIDDPLVLYVSGGNSQILELANKPFPHYSVLGETFDIGIGNMLDSFARALGLNPAWGSSIERTAEKGSYIKMPYTVKGMDFSFTGLLTNCIKLIGKESKENICFSMQENAYAMLCEATERALFLTGKKELLISGGVAQSNRLKEMLKCISMDHGIKMGYVQNEFNADNGAMIAMVGERMIQNGKYSSISDCKIDQKYRTDKAEVCR